MQSKTTKDYNLWPFYSAGGFNLQLIVFFFYMVHLRWMQTPLKLKTEVTTFSLISAFI